jgi:uncharacterized protein (DUF1330 family)
MRTAIAFAALAGAAFGTAGTSLLNAQPRPAAYVIEENEALDPAALKEFGPKASATIKQHGGEFIVGPGARTVTLVGDAPKRPVVLRFDSLEKAEAWFRSADYQALNELREKAMKKRAYIAEAAR